MFGSMERVRQLQQIAQDPTESEIVQALVKVVVTLETRQLSAVENLHDAMDVDGLDVQTTEEQRQQQLLDLVDALASGDLRGWWFEEVAGEHLENVEDAMAYAGLDSDEWADQKGRWAESYRERGGEDVEDYSDEDLARLHVERRFGVSLQEFEREVVDWSRRDALQTVLAGRFQAVEQGIAQATEAARQENADA